jgi:cobalt-zinc-cadmium efflux system outer membrane protein
MVTYRDRITLATTLAVWLPASAAAQAAQSVTAAASAPPTQAVVAPLPDALTLETATERFLRRNIAVEAARYEVDVAERIGAGLRPRPGLTTSVENVPVSGETAFGRLYEVSVTVAQPIELGSRAERRLDVADRTVALAEARLTDVLSRRLFDLKRTYYEALLRRALLELDRENRDNFAELVRYNTARFEEGEVAEGDLIRVRLERARYESAVATTELAFRQAKIRLLELIGDSDYERAASLEVGGAFASGAAVVDLATLRQAALETRPDVKIAHAEVALAESVGRLERARARGEVTPFAGYRRVGVDNTIVAGVTVPLPFGNRNQEGVARADAQRRVAEANLRLARARALADVESAFRAYETAREQVRVYEREVLRQADEARDIQLAAYREGAVELFALVDAQRTRAEMRAGYFRAMLDYQTSLFQLELATGVEIKP